MFALIWTVAALCLPWPGDMAAAQSADTEAVEEVPELIGPPLPGPEDLDPASAELAAWYSLATRAESALTDGVASEFALMRLRSAVVDWRDRFLGEERNNAARIATVTAQIEALGPVPEGDVEEEPRIAARRAELEAQLRKLRAPVRLAQEAYVHADGLVGELDAALRAGRTGALAVRGPSPLDPDIWPAAAAALGDRAAAIATELRTSFASAARRETFVRNVGSVGTFALLALILLWRGQVWTGWVIAFVDRSTGTAGASRSTEEGADTDGATTVPPVPGAETTVAAMQPGRGVGVWRLLASLGQVVLPLIGLIALQIALTRSGLFGYRMMRVVEAIPAAGANVIIARWLAGQFFAPERAARSTLDIALPVRARIRRLLGLLGWVLAASTIVEAVVGSGETPEAGVVILNLPLVLALAFVLFALGRHFTQVRLKSTGDDQSRRRAEVLPLFGRILVIIAIAGPILTIFGYSRAADALIPPAILTLALMGVVILLQRLVFDIYALISGSTRRSEDALAPVLIGFTLILAAMPVLALIWGMRVEELSEIWARFREGYSLGETRISPTDFITFAVVFGVGYVVTRLLQSTLRGSILPRTRLDTGARNAIVAGLGYVGIFAAALAAITMAGINLSSLAIVAGALSVGIGFGLQNIVSNFVSGIILLIERPISEGDWIEVGPQMGYVRAISVRSTRIETFDRTDVIIPNADLVSGTVTNWTRNNSVGRVIVPVGVAYGTDTARVDAILREIAEANPMVLLQPPPNVFFLGFGADSLNFEIRAILRDINFVMVVTSEMNHAIAERFAAEGIEIPFAQRDIWLRNPEALHAGSSTTSAVGEVPAGAGEAEMAIEDDKTGHKRAPRPD